MTSRAVNDPCKKHSPCATSAAPRGVAKPRRSRFPTHHQRKLATYVAEGHHLVFDTDRQQRGLNPYRAKPITQLALEAGMSATVARYWLRQEHYSLWLRWWSGLSPALWDDVEVARGQK